MSDATETEQAKTALRAEALARRDALPAAERAAAAAAIAARPFPLQVVSRHDRGRLFADEGEVGDQSDPADAQARDAGAQLALPAIAGRGQPLIMRAWRFGAPLASGQWGIREPMPDAPEVAPDILIVPLAAFDRAGHRIGYGAGYYDMTINALRAKKKVIAIGIAYAAQEIPKVPATERDARLDLVLTEREVIDFRSA